MDIDFRAAPDAGGPRDADVVGRLLGVLSTGSQFPVDCVKGNADGTLMGLRFRARGEAVVAAYWTEGAGFGGWWTDNRSPEQRPSQLRSPRAPAAKPAPSAAAQPQVDPICELASSWTRLYDQKLDGQLDRELTMNQVELAASKSATDKKSFPLKLLPALMTGAPDLKVFVGKHINEEKNNKSRFFVLCSAQAKRIEMVQIDKKYRAEFVITRNSSGELAGMWRDNKGGSGDMVLAPAGGM